MSCSRLADCSSPDLPGCAVRDAEDQRVVLAFLLGKHPIQLTIPEVARALYAGVGGFESDDAVERAIRDLVGRGFLHCHGPFVLPSQAPCPTRTEAE